MRHTDRDERKMLRAALILILLGAIALWCVPAPTQAEDVEPQPVDFQWSPVTNRVDGSEITATELDRYVLSCWVVDEAAPAQRSDSEPTTKVFANDSTRGTAMLAPDNYTCSLRVFDNDGRGSAPSDSVNVSVAEPEPTGPLAPTNLAATILSKVMGAAGGIVKADVRFSWQPPDTDLSDGATYSLACQRAADATVKSSLFSARAGNATDVTLGLPYGSWSCRIHTTDQGKTSGPSDAATVVLIAPPAKPIGVNEAAQD